MRPNTNSCITFTAFILLALAGVGDAYAKASEAHELLKVKMSIHKLDTNKNITREDLISAGQFGGHLFPTEPASSPSLANKSLIQSATATQELMRLKFGQAIQKWNEHQYKSAYKDFEKYIEKYPDSPWAGEAKLHMACEARYNGRYTEAEKTFSSIISEYQDRDYIGSKMLVDKAKSRLAVLKILENNPGDAISQLSDIKNKSVDWRLRTYASNWIQRIGREKSNDISLLDCGTRALAYILKKQGRKKESREVLSIAPEEKGQSFVQLKRIAEKYNLPVTPLNIDIADLPKMSLPVIVQIDSNGNGETGHYWVVENIDKNVVTLHDPQMPRRFKQSLSEFQQEWNGNTLAFSDSKDLPGRVLSVKESSSIYGGCCGVQRPESELGKPGSTGDDSPSDDEDAPCAQGAPVWQVNPVNMNFYMTDIPLWYEPALGPKIKIKLSYNSQSAIAQYEPFGNKWSFNYGSYLLVDPGETVTVFMPDGRRDVYTPSTNGAYAAPYGIQNKLTKIEENHFLLQFLDGSEFEYKIPTGSDSMQPFLVRQTDKNGLSLTFDYDENVNIKSITDATGGITQFAYNSQGLVKGVTDPFGRTASFEYDENSNLIKLTDMGGYSSELTYDSDIYPQSLKNPLGEWAFDFEPASDQSNGSNAYPAPGQKMWENYRITITNPVGGKEEYYYNGYSGYSWYISPKHYVEYADSSRNNFKSAPKTKYEFVKVYNNIGRIKKITTPEGDFVSYSYDKSSGRKISKTDSQGNKTQYTYNQDGKLSSIIRPNGQATTFEYGSSSSNLTSVTNSIGSIEIGYDEKGRPISFTDINGNISSATYDGYGRIATTQNTLQQTTHYIYGSNNRLARIVFNNLIISEFTYDKKGRLKSIKTGDQYLTQYNYNDLNSVTEIVHPDGSSESFSYASCPRLVQQTNSRNGITTKYRYDGMKRLVAEINLKNWQNSYLYDENSNLSALVDVNNNSTKFTYDKNDRLVSTTYSDGSKTSHDYNNRGLRTKTLNARGVETTYSYDVNGNLTSVSYSDNTPNVAYTYDELDRLIEVSDGIGVTQFTYNPDSTLSSIDGPWENDTVLLTYDEGQKLILLSVNKGQAQEFIYDSLNRLSSIHAGSRAFNYEYLNNSNTVGSLSLPNGSETDYSYSTGKLLESINNRTSAGEILSKYQYTYNDQKLVVSESKTQTLASLTPSEKIQFTNNNLNQTVKAGSKNLSFDADGNLVSGYTPAGYSFEAEYNAENQLKQITYTDDNGLQHKKTYHYHWNHLLAQVNTFVNGDLVDELRIVRASFLPLQDRNAQNEVRREYIWGVGVGGGVGSLLSATIDGSDYYYHYDGKGNVASISDSAENEVAEYSYSSYGQISNRSGSLNQPFTFSTKRLDYDTGLLYFGYRYYVPMLQKWLTRDPIGTNGGVNLYSYLGGNPVMAADIYGLEKWTMDGIGNTSFCSYYDDMAKKNPGCGYFKEAASICRGKRSIVNGAMNTGIVSAWALGNTSKSQSEVYNSVRKKLIFYDKQSRQTGHIDKNGCTCGDTVDFYHKISFGESGISPIFYGGTVWPQNTRPNPVPYDPRGSQWLDDLFN